MKMNFLLSLRQLHSMSPSYLIKIVKDFIIRRNPDSLLHPHGFWVVLLNKTEQEEWRFHYWPKHSRPIVGMPATIHTHDKVVESRILLGELQNKIYNLDYIESDGQPIYEVEYHGDKHIQNTFNVLNITNKRAKAAIKQESILTLGDSYRVEPHTYHEAVVAENTAAATIVCMHSRVTGSPKVLGLTSYPDEIVFKRSSKKARYLLQEI